MHRANMRKGTVKLTGISTMLTQESDSFPLFILHGVLNLTSVFSLLETFNDRCLIQSILLLQTVTVLQSLDCSFRFKFTKMHFAMLCSTQCAIVELLQDRHNLLLKYDIFEQSSSVHSLCTAHKLQCLTSLGRNLVESMTLLKED